MFKSGISDHGLLNTRPYISDFQGQKLRDQFSENLMLSIYEFLFNSGDRISKEKKLRKF